MLGTLNLRQVSTDEVRGCLSDQNVAFATTVSFEDRCTSGSTVVADLCGRIDRCMLFDYPTVAEPIQADHRLRREHADLIKKALDRKCDRVTTVRVNPFAINELAETTRALFEGNEHVPIVIDFTCMTRIHLFAVASLVSEGRMRGRKVLFCYSQPESYNPRPGLRAGWPDTIVVPVGRHRVFRREGHARGVVIVGHDAERLSVALSELEPAAGSLIYTKTEGRPDFLRRARESNKETAGRLLGMKMPQATAQALSESTNAWKEWTVGVMSFRELNIALGDQIRAAEADDGPIVLYPFGPKPLSLATAVIFASNDTVVSWAVYPIRDKYKVGYTEGTAEVYWMDVVGSNSVRDH